MRCMERGLDGGCNVWLPEDEPSVVHGPVLFNPILHPYLLQHSSKAVRLADDFLVVT
jgi:hypothetical protein